MGHTIAEKEKLLSRVRMLKAQLGAVEAAFKADATSSEILPLVTSARGVVNSLMADVLEDHIRFHLVEENATLGASGRGAAEDLIEVVQGYMGQR